MNHLITGFAGIGILATLMGLVVMVKFLFETHYKRYYSGIREQIITAVTHMREILEEENRTSPETTWILDEIRKITRTREFRTKDRLHQNLKHLKENNHSPGSSVD